MSEPVALMELRQVSKSFRSQGRVVTAVRDASIAVGPGEVIGIVGESGSGKTTVARIMAGLETTTQGEVVLDREVVGIKRTLLQRKQVQIVFQDPRSSLNPRMSIVASVEDFAVVHRLGNRAERRRRALEALAQVRLSPSVAERRPPELSGGQLQRACLARALITEPRLLIADEPTSSLDVSIQSQILNLLDELRASLSIVLISHDMGVIRFMSDRVYVMLNGEVVESGGTDQIMNNPGHEYTRRLIRATLLEPSDA